MDPILHNELTRRRGGAWQEVEARDARALIVYATDGRGQNIRYLTNFSPIYGDALFVMTPRRHGYLLNFDWEIPRAREDSAHPRAHRACSDHCCLSHFSHLPSFLSS